MTDPIERYLALRSSRPEVFLQPTDPSVGYEVLLPSGDEEASEWRVRAEREGVGLLYQSPWFILLKDLVLNRGAKDYGPFTYERLLAVHAKPAVVVAGRLSNGDIVFIDVYRHATRRHHLELPRGFAEVDGDALEHAHAELQQETGYVMEEARVLGSVHPDTGILGTELLVVSGLAEPRGEPSPEPREAIRGVISLGPEEIWRRAGADIDDGISLAALFIMAARGLLPFPLPPS